MLLIPTRLWFLSPAPRPGWPRVAYAFSLGQVVNNFLPVRTGDLVKAMLIARPRSASGRTVAETLGVMIADSLVDITGLTLLILCVGPGDLLAVGPGGAHLVMVAAVVAIVAVGVVVAR